MQKRVETATEYLRTNNARIFDGDSIALMMSVYKNEDMPLNLRLQCAMAVAPFERPRLVATASVTKRVEGDDAAFGKLFQKIEQRLALQPPAARQVVIDMLRAGDDEVV